MDPDCLGNRDFLYQAVNRPIGQVYPGDTCCICMVTDEGRVKESMDELGELMDALKELIKLWPQILFAVVFFGGSIFLLIWTIKGNLRTQRKLQMENQMFELAAARVTGQFIEAEEKFRMVHDGYDSNHDKEYRREEYLRATFAYVVDGKTYKTKRNFDILEQIPQQHEFLYEPGVPQKVYWTASGLNPAGKGHGRGCLTGFLIWVGFTLLVNIIARGLGIF